MWGCFHKTSIDFFFYFQYVPNISYLLHFLICSSMINKKYFVLISYILTWWYKAEYFSRSTENVLCCSKEFTVSDNDTWVWMMFTTILKIVQIMCYMISLPGAQEQDRVDLRLRCCSFRIGRFLSLILVGVGYESTLCQL